MIYNKFKDLSLSALGFGTMRLPMLEDGSIDQALVNEMVDYAIEHGVNYFDTAYAYHGGFSETSISAALRRHPRDKWKLATKFPGYQTLSSYDPEVLFNEQLEKCGVEYFDFYLLHNVNDDSIHTYLDPRWGIVEYFVEQKKLGRIKHLGFSCHCGVKGLEDFLDKVGEHMEFCQIQLNYLDWTLRDAKTKYELLTRRGIPVWVMEPVRGGALSSLSSEDELRMKALRPEESISAWAFRFLQRLDNVTMILSGMSNMEHMRDNVKTFSSFLPLTDSEAELTLEVAEKLKSTVPCTACRYCCDGCPSGLDIPRLVAWYNGALLGWGSAYMVQMHAMPMDKLPSACISCGQCASVCPQSIDVPDILSRLDAIFQRKRASEAREIQRDEEALRRRQERATAKNKHQ